MSELLQRVSALAAKWEDPVGKTAFEAMIERGYAAELRRAIDGETDGEWYARMNGLI